MANAIGARCVVGISAFLMLACGLGIILAMFIGLTYLLGHAFYVLHVPLWAHGFSLIIPSIIGFFVACGCGCCNKKAAYIVSAIFDTLGVLAFLGPLTRLWALAAMFLAYGRFDCYQRSSGRCVCREDPAVDYYVMTGTAFGLHENCNHYAALFNSGVLLATMWAFGFLALIIHLALVIYLACTYKEEDRSATTGQVIGMPGGQGAMLMTSPPSAYYQGGNAPPSYNQQPPSMHGQPAYMQHAQHGYSGGYGQGGYYPQDYPMSNYPSQGGPSAPPEDYPTKTPM